MPTSTIHKLHPTGTVTSKRPRAPKLSSADREKMIVTSATAYFARHGFQANTRDLAKSIGVTQSLLFHYFPNKQALVEKVYEAVYLSRWDPHWTGLVNDRSLSLHERLNRYYLEYARLVLQDDWVRILIFAGLEDAGFNDRFFKLQVDRILGPVVRECIAEFNPPELQGFDIRNYDIEKELVLALHASIFYIGMRKWVYRTILPADTNLTIAALVTGFLEAMRSRIRSSASFRQASAPVAVSVAAPARAARLKKKG
jgi:AcrR family transcriptional regulator